MIFLIVYDRPISRIVTFEVFDDAELFKAENTRLDIELAVNREGADREVVLLQAKNETALRRTHRRYFETMRELISPPAA